MLDGAILWWFARLTANDSALGTWVGFGLRSGLGVGSGLGFGFGLGLAFGFGFGFGFGLSLG